MLYVAWMLHKVLQWLNHLPLNSGFAGLILCVTTFSINSCEKRKLMIWCILCFLAFCFASIGMLLSPENSLSRGAMFLSNVLGVLSLPRGNNFWRIFSNSRSFKSQFWFWIKACQVHRRTTVCIRYVCPCFLAVDGVQKGAHVDKFFWTFSENQQRETTHWGIWRIRSEILYLSNWEVSLVFILIVHFKLEHEGVS